MLCENCGENEANVKYTQIINGVKKEMSLCDKCSKELGIDKIDFSIPINFSSFLGDFFEEEKDFLPSFVENEISCDKCGMTYDDFTSEGKFGCANCYNFFSKKIDNVVKNIHGANRHVGRGLPKSNKQESYNNTKKVTVNNEKQKKTTEGKIINNEEENVETLKRDLKLAIQEERYEDAAKLRDEIKKLEK